MINNRTRVAIVGAVLIAVLSLGGLIGLPKAFGVPPEGVPPQPSAAYILDVLECFGDHSEACCTGVALTNAHAAIACFISSCGPATIPPDPIGSIAGLTGMVREFFGVGPNAVNPCEE
jgi:hypothetical protein